MAFAVVVAASMGCGGGGGAGSGGTSGHAGTVGAAGTTGGAGAGGASGHAGAAGTAGAGGASGASGVCGGIVADQSADCGGCISSDQGFCDIELACANDPACRQVVETGQGDCSNSNYLTLIYTATFECNCVANIFPCQSPPTDGSTGGQDASTGGHDAGCTEFVGPSSDCEACLETHCCAAAAACSQDTACEEQVGNGGGSSATFSALHSCSNTFSCSGTCAFN